MSECTENNNVCATCDKENCPSRKQASLLIKTNENSHIKKKIAIVSGKGGVGKSMVTSMLAVETRRKGYQTAILDADITGPSIPQAFGIHGQLYATEKAIIPACSATGIELVSTNLILESESQPVIWRGSIIAGMVKQFYSEVDWGDVDYMFVDMPPGTGDVPLTVFQSIKPDAVIIVSTPQQLVGMIVEKAINMAKMMNIPVLGLIENMSYVKCDQCGNKIALFGSSNTGEIARQYGLELLAQLPLDSRLTAAMDEGKIELFPEEYLDVVVNRLEQLF